MGARAQNHESRVSQPRLSPKGEEEKQSPTQLYLTMFYRTGLDANSTLTLRQPYAGMLCGPTGVGKRGPSRAQAVDGPKVEAVLATLVALASL